MSDTPYFDDDGQPVNVTDFDYASLDPESPRALADDDAGRIRQQTLCRTFAMLTSGKNSVETIGRKCLLMAFLAGQAPEKTQSDIAKRLGLSPGRVSQLLAEIETA